MAHVYVAIGSNVNAEDNVTKAANELARLFPDVRFSSWYRNRAVGFEGDDFINGVAAFTRNAPRWAPRAMDLDVLLYDDVVCSEPGLTLPRPDLLKRPYMLGPLAEIAPEVIHPTAGVTIGQLWERFDRDAHAMTRVDLKGLPHSGRRPPPGSGR
jgi:2-amino-4-hydroxy-6-hydroxymethyldihydropteridine diphosphokinase